MKALFSSIFVLAVALATSASAQLSFQGGRVGVSHFELHDYFIEPYDPSYSFSSYYKETELNFDLVYSADQFGFQAGGYFGERKLAPSISPPLATIWRQPAWLLHQPEREQIWGRNSILTRSEPDPLVLRRPSRWR